MRKSVAMAALTLPFPAAGMAQTSPGLGAEEFGMIRRQLVQAIEQGEELIAKCLRELGFQYMAADFKTVKADKTMFLVPVDERIQQDSSSRKV